MGPMIAFMGRHKRHNEFTPNPLPFGNHSVTPRMFMAQLPTESVAFYLRLGAASAAAPLLALPGGAKQGARPGDPPAIKGAIILFSGKQDDVSANWLARNGASPAAWNVVEGAMVARGGDIMTKERFTDYQLHVEFK